VFVICRNISEHTYNLAKFHLEIQLRIAIIKYEEILYLQHLQMMIPMTKELDVLMRESIKRERYGSVEQALNLLYDVYDCAEERFLKNPCADNEERLYEIE